MLIPFCGLYIKILFDGEMMGMEKRLLNDSYTFRNSPQIIERQRRVKGLGKL
jgi:hypothetical protein